MTNQIIQHLKQSSVPLIIIGDIDVEEIKKGLEISASDFFEVFDGLEAEIIKIEKTKEILHFISLKPYNSELKLIVIYLAEKMTTEAANNLLKTLEEPPIYARIILTTKAEKLILPTIISRCRKILTLEKENLEAPENYLSPEELSKMSVAEKFNWVAEISESTDINVILSLWQQYFRKKMLAGENVIEVLKEISQAKDLLMTNISVKLLLENLVLGFRDEK